MLLEKILDYKGNLLPPPDFDTIVQYYKEFCMNKRYPFKELLNDYVENKIILILYGQQLLRSLLNNKNYLITEKLYNQCMKINIKEEKDLSQKFPEILKEILSHISFIIPCENEDLVVRNFFSSSHLQNYRRYSQPFKTSFINNIVYSYQELKNLSLNFLKSKIFKCVNENSSVILILPLPKFNSYPSVYNSWKELIMPKCSSFTQYESSELYKW
ncbi:hypothetical protein C2G38_2208065 [Gigaspora rosea]|uniref:Uncharacterized protein n=1 Tax=Gigaspora rosea TaxID=44941 RepID=A0A397URB5_9GLOM|nr:hypothetical protein C2G38_2208065 [Gigaspora rosea]